MYVCVCVYVYVCLVRKKMVSDRLNNDRNSGHPYGCHSNSHHYCHDAEHVACQVKPKRKPCDTNGTFSCDARRAVSQGSFRPCKSANHSACREALAGYAWRLLVRCSTTSQRIPHRIPSNPNPS